MTEQYPRTNVNVRPRGARYIVSAPGDTAFDLTFDDSLIVADSPTLLVLTLPSASEFEGFEITVHAVSATLAEYVMILGRDGETIVGPGAVVLNAPGQAIKLAAQFNRDEDGNIIRTGWYCTDECAGRADCPVIDALVPNILFEDTGAQLTQMTGSFDPVNDVFLEGTVLVDGAFPFIDIQATTVDVVVETDLIEPGVYWIGILRLTTNCATFVPMEIATFSFDPGPGPGPGPDPDDDGPGPGPIIDGP